MTQRLLCLGECMVELAEIGPATYRRGFAGDTFNTAWYARRALGSGWEVSYASCIGEDAVSNEMAAFMAEEGVATDTLRRIPDRTVGLYMIGLKDGERAFSYWRETSAARCLADDPAWLDGVLASARHVHLSGITLAILPPDGRSGLFEALGRARARGVTVSFDTNIRPRLWESPETLRAAMEAAASVSDIVLPSFDEEVVYFEDKTPSDTIARYRASGARIVVVKNGALSIAAAGDDGETIAIAVEPVAKVVDSTAAGDSFAGGFLAAHLQGKDLRTAIEAGSALASNVIQAHGALVR